MNMIERVARAMARKRIEFLNNIECRNYDEKMILKSVEASYFHYLDNAKTAIETMKEPTAEMKIAALHDYMAYEIKGPNKPAWNATTMWNAMIDAALKE